jgi:hypothetical protein
MQAITVLLLELAQGTSRLSEDSSKISTGVEKLTRWLAIMKILDRVAGSAYNMVGKMLSKHDQFARELVPGPWLDEVMQAESSDPTTFANDEPQVHLGSGFQNFSDNSYSAMSFGNEYNTTINNGTYDPNNLVDPLSYSYGSFQFGQPQYPLFYGNQFATLFDQDLSYAYDDNTNMEDWDTSGEQQQTPPR